MDLTRGSPFHLTLIVLCLLAVPFATLQHHSSSPGGLTWADATDGTSGVIWGNPSADIETGPTVSVIENYVIASPIRQQDAALSFILDPVADAYHSGLSSALQLRHTAHVAGRQQYAPPLRL